MKTTEEAASVVLAIILSSACSSTGHAVCEFKNGQPYQGAFAEGPSGDWQCYDEKTRDRNGHHGLHEYEGGAISRSVGFHSNGTKRIEQRYVADSKLTSTTLWYDNGRRLQELHYIPFQIRPSGGGQLQGAARGWSRDGELLWEGEYRAGKPWTGTFPEGDFLHGDVRVVQYAEGAKSAAVDSQSR